MFALVKSRWLIVPAVVMLLTQFCMPSWAEEKADETAAEQASPAAPQEKTAKSDQREAKQAAKEAAKQAAREAKQAKKAEEKAKKEAKQAGGAEQQSTKAESKVYEGSAVTEEHRYTADPPCAAKARHYVRIPVYFITDRNREHPDQLCKGVKFGNHRQYLGACNHDPAMGIAYCVIENTKKKTICGKLAGLGWEAAQREHEGAYSIKLFDGCTYEEAKDKACAAVHEKAQLSEDHEVFVFAPGYLSTFGSGLREAARFAYYTERPVILYSWPSRGSFKAYTTDEASIEWSQEHFNDLINEMIEVGKKDPTIRFRLIAHSMGSRLLLRAAPLLRGNPIFKEVAVVCPDIDDGLVKHYVTRCMTANGTTTVRLYLSRKDRMLMLSQLVHGGYARLGESGGILPPSPYKSVSDETEGSTCSISPDMLKRFQTIDFTRLDEGTLGHKIPVRLMVALSQTDKPPADMELKFEEGYKPSASTRLLMHVSHLGSYQKSGAPYFEVISHEKRSLAHGVRSKLPLMHTFIGRDWTLK